MAEALVKRFWLFAGSFYYATGGMHDFQGSYATLAQAQEAALILHLPQSGGAEADWHHVVDTTTGQIVAGTRLQAHDAPDLALPEERLYHG